jgi:glycosyltransferase involved in cell wall biosynthesis
VFSQFLQERGQHYLEGKLNIACWAWEISEFPREWESHFRHLDEIWVPSNFALDAISRVAPIPVLRMPHSIPDWLPMKKCDRSQFGIQQSAFVFLFVFDFASSCARKNPLAIIEAFKSAFGSGDRAMLILKSARSEEDPAAAKALAQAASNANIRILDAVLPRDEINALINTCNCYVSLHRSEGFGLTIAEAMSLGKPVIATDYSGNADFMNSSNSFPVRFRMVEIEQDFGQYRRGYSWAQPDIAHAAQLMRSVFNDTSAAARMGKQGRRDIVQHLNPLSVGKRMQERLLRHAAPRSPKLPDWHQS